MTGNFSSKAFITSTGMAAPPAMQKRSEDRSTSRPSWWSSAKYMVGTPAKSVTLSRSMMASASSGVKRGSSVKVPPTAIEAFWMQV